MKPFKTIISLLLLILLSQVVGAQTSDKKSISDSTGLPGDNFSLQGALELFKKSSTLEDFEKRLNEKSNNVNNLDLNGDNKVDYIKVTDKMEKNVHAIVLRTNVNAKESQDVAVIAVEKTEDKSAVAQIIGNEVLYGKDVIIEPLSTEESQTSSPRDKGPYSPEIRRDIIIVNVWYWPVIQYIYMPDYVAWSSPWYWGYYPPYWYPWTPYSWYWHHQYSMHYHHHCHVVNVYRVPRAQNVYSSHRKSSPTVQRQIARQAPVKEGRKSEINNQKSVRRPVEGTPGQRNKDNVTPSRKQTPATTPQRKAPEVRPQQQRNPQTAPRRQQNQQVNPVPRQNPQISRPPASPPRQTPVSRPPQGVKRGGR